MNKKVFGRKLSRSKPSRQGLFVGLMQTFILNGKIATTQAKALAVQGSIDKLVTLAKKGDLTARRSALSKLGNKREVVAKLFDYTNNSFKERNSGFTRIIKIKPRKGDNAPMVIIEWVSSAVSQDKEVVKKEDK